MCIQFVSDVSVCMWFERLFSVSAGHPFVSDVSVGMWFERVISMCAGHPFSLNCIVLAPGGRG